MSAYVFVQTEVGRAAPVANDVAKLDGVQSAKSVTGPYDVIVHAEVESVDELGRLVVSRIQLVEAITRTVTCPVIHL